MQLSLRLPLSLTGAAALALSSSPFQPVTAQEDDGRAAVLSEQVKWFDDDKKPT
ncbi:hypothetical protein [Prochlorococcus marinus]|uniref:hypothetical protein n=1 Tax=Prochlorococcus TaxID=1218 RepID=UPI000AB170CA|nr:hypothetical protein [Prochlorococcus marinus]